MRPRSKVAFALVLGLLAALVAPAAAVIPNAQKIADAVAKTNRAEGRAAPLIFDVTLRIGDSLRQKIDQGLASSRVGLVVLSSAFISKGWTNYELDGIVTRTVSGEQILLPIWHNITKQQVVDFSPSLADKVAPIAERREPFGEGGHTLWDEAGIGRIGHDVAR